MAIELKYPLQETWSNKSPCSTSKKYNWSSSLTKRDRLKENVFYRWEEQKISAVKIPFDVQNPDQIDFFGGLSHRSSNIANTSGRKINHNLRYEQENSGCEEPIDWIQLDHHQISMNQENKLKAEPNENNDIYRKAVSSKRPKIPKNTKDRVNTVNWVASKQSGIKAKQKTQKLSINLNESSWRNTEIGLIDPVQKGIISLWASSKKEKLGTFS